MVTSFERRRSVQFKSVSLTANVHLSIPCPSARSSLLLNVGNDRLPRFIPILYLPPEQHMSAIDMCGELKNRYPGVTCAEYIESPREGIGTVFTDLTRTSASLWTVSEPFAGRFRTETGNYCKRPASPDPRPFYEHPTRGFWRVRVSMSEKQFGET